MEPCRFRGFHAGMNRGNGRRWARERVGRRAAHGLVELGTGLPWWAWCCGPHFGPKSGQNLAYKKKIQFKPALGTNWALPWALGRAKIRRK